MYWIILLFPLLGTATTHFDGVALTRHYENERQCVVFEEQLHKKAVNGGFLTTCVQVTRKLL